MEGSWTSKWPNKMGVYLFYGYMINSSVESIPRLHLVTVEYVSEMFGIQYRTARYTIKRDTGAHGVWMPVIIPDIPKLDEEAAGRAARYTHHVREVKFYDE